MKVSHLYRPKAIAEKALSPFLDRTVFVGTKEDPTEVKVRQVVRTILGELEKEDLAGQCELTLGGSYLSHLLVRPRPYNDGDCKISIVKKDSQEDLSALAFKAEAAMKRALLSLKGKNPEEQVGIEELVGSYRIPMFFSSRFFAPRVVGTYSFDAKQEKNEQGFSLEVSVCALEDPRSPLYILASDSFTVPLTLKEGKLASPGPEGVETRPGSFWLYSYEGDCEEVEAVVQNGIIASKNERESNGDGWFKILREMTVLGDRVLDVNLYRNFYQGTTRSKATQFNEKKKLGHAYFSFLANAFFYDLDFYEAMQEELRKMVLQEGEEGFAAFLQNSLAGRSSEEAKALLKGLMPLFAKELDLVEHLGEKHLRCKLQVGEKESYVLVPPLQGREEETLFRFFCEKQAQLPFAWTSLKKAPQEIVFGALERIERLSSHSPQAVLLAMAWLKKLIECLESPVERTKASIGCIDAAVRAYAKRNEEVPAQLWQEMKDLVRPHRKEPWKRLFDRLIQSVFFPLSLEGQSFFDGLFEQAFHGEEDFFEESPTEEKVQQVKRLFQGSVRKDPFDFSQKLKHFLERNELQKALNLLRYQSGLFGFLAIQPVCQKICSQQTSPTFQEEYESLFLHALGCEEDPKKKWQMVSTAYISLSKSSSLEQILERELFIAAPEALTRGLTDEKAFCRALKEKIRRGPEDEKMGQRLKLLSEQTTEIESDLVFELLMKRKHIPELLCYFPSVCREQMKKIKEDADRFELVQQCTKVPLDPQMVKECLILLGLISPVFMEARKEEGRRVMVALRDLLSCSERINFVKFRIKGPLNPWEEEICSDLLSFDEKERRESAQNISWTLDAMKKFTDFLCKKGISFQGIADVFASKLDERDLASEEGILFLEQLLPFLGEAAKRKCFRRHIHKVFNEMQIVSRRKSVYRSLSFLLREEFSFCWSEEKDEEKERKFLQQREEVRGFCFSSLDQKRERFFDLSLKKQEALEKEEIAYLAALFQSRLLAVQEKQHFLRQSLSRSEQSSKLLSVQMDCFRSFTDWGFLNTWGLLEIERGWKVLERQKDGPRHLKTEYAQGAWEALKEMEALLPQKMVSYLSEDSRKEFFKVLDLKSEDYKKSLHPERIRSFLSYMIGLDQKCFSEEKAFYSVFLRFALLYLTQSLGAGTREQLLLDQMIPILRQNVPSEEEERSLYYMVMTALGGCEAKIIPVVYQHLDQVPIEECPVFLAFLKEWSMDDKHLLAKVILELVQKEGFTSQRILFLKELLFVLESVQEKQQKSSLFKNWERSVLSLAQEVSRTYVQGSEEVSLEDLADLSGVLCRIFESNRSGAESSAAYLGLIKDVHSARLQEKEEERKRRGEPVSYFSKDKDLDIYAKFLEGRCRTERKPLELFVLEQGLFYGEGWFSLFLKKDRRKDLPLNLQKGLRQDLKSFFEVKSLSQSPPKELMSLVRLSDALMSVYFIEEPLKEFEEDLQNFLSALGRFEKSQHPINFVISHHAQSLHQSDLTLDQLQCLVADMTLPLLKQGCRDLKDQRSLWSYSYENIATLAQTLYLKLYPGFSCIELKECMKEPLSFLCQDPEEEHRMFLTVEQMKQEADKVLCALDVHYMSYAGFRKIFDYAMLYVSLLKKVRRTEGLFERIPYEEKISSYLLYVLKGLERRGKDLSSGEKADLLDCLKHLQNMIPIERKTPSFMEQIKKIREQLE